MSLDTALKITLGLEGGYSNNPNDHGGATNYGITQAVYDEYNLNHRLPKAPVKLITLDIAKKIYERNYWLDSRCDLIMVTHPSVAIIHFDCAVNCGIFQAGKLFQRAIGTLDDGVIGPVSIKVLEVLTDKQASVAYLNQRLIFYTKLILNNPSQRQFKSTWFHRLTKLSDELNLGWTAK